MPLPAFGYHGIDKSALYQGFREFSRSLLYTFLGWLPFNKWELSIYLTWEDNNCKQNYECMLAGVSRDPHPIFLKQQCACVNSISATRFHFQEFPTCVEQGVLTPCVEVEVSIPTFQTKSSTK